MTGAGGTRRVRVSLDDGISVSTWVRDALPPPPGERAEQLDTVRRLATEGGAFEMSPFRLVSSIQVEGRRYDTWWGRQIQDDQGSPGRAGPGARPLLAFFVLVRGLATRYASTYLGPPFAAEGAEDLPPEQAAERIAVVDHHAHDGRERELAIYRRRAAAEPDRVDSHYELGLTIWFHHFTGSPGAVDEAEAPLRRAIALAPKAHAPRGLLGEVLLRAGRAEDAAPAFTEAVRRRPRHPRYHYCLSVALEEIGDAAAAARALARAKRAAGPRLRTRFSRASNPLADYRSALIGEATRIRKKREGLVGATEREIAEDQRARNAVLLSEVPEDLHAIVPLVEKWGLGDGPSRQYFVRRATREEKQELRRAHRHHGPGIRAWIDSVDPAKETPAYTTFLYFLDACEEMGIGPPD